MPNNAKCETCVFFDPGDKKIDDGQDKLTVGACKRYPPTVVYNVNVAAREYCPDVAANDWCGEYEYNTEFDKADDGKASPEDA